MARSPRTPGEVIDKAIDENRFGEYLCYFLTAMFALTGTAVLLYGARQNQGLVAFAGGIGSALFWPALNQARCIRRQNLCIRLLEAPLSNAATSQEAATVLRDFFAREFVDPGDPTGRSTTPIAQQPETPQC